MRLIILGAGAIGGVVCARLSRAGRDVTLIARGAQLAAIREHGLRLESPDETFVVQPSVTERFTDWRDGDVLLLAREDAGCRGRTARARRAARGADRVPHEWRGGRTDRAPSRTRGVRRMRDDAGDLSVAGTRAGLGVSGPRRHRYRALSRTAGDITDELVGELLVAGFASEPRTHIMRWKRGKLLSNLANGAEALCGPDARRSVIAERARAEARACFAAAGLSTTTDAEDAARRAGFDSKLIAGAARDGGSTWQSLARGASTLETDYLNGEIACWADYTAWPRRSTSCSSSSLRTLHVRAQSLARCRSTR